MSTVLAYEGGKKVWHPDGVDHQEAQRRPIMATATEDTPAPEGCGPDADPAEPAEESLTRAAKAYRRTEKAHEEARRELKQAAVRAMAAGVKQSDVVKVTGWTREYLRRLKKDKKDKKVSKDTKDTKDAKDAKGARGVKGKGAEKGRGRIGGD